MVNIAAAQARLDVGDGIVARGRRHSPFGADLDSLADIVSFGVAPAVLGFTLGMRGGWDALVLCAFVCCGVSRLARYNVTAAALSGDRVALGILLAAAQRAAQTPIESLGVDSWAELKHPDMSASVTVP